MICTCFIVLVISTASSIIFCCRKTPSGIGLPKLSENNVLQSCVMWKCIYFSTSDIHYNNNNYASAHDGISSLWHMHLHVARDIRFVHLHTANNQRMMLGDLLSSLLARGSKLRDEMIISSLDGKPSARAQHVSVADVQGYAYILDYYYYYYIQFLFNWPSFSHYRLGQASWRSLEKKSKWGLLVQHSFTGWMLCLSPD